MFYVIILLHTNNLLRHVSEKWTGTRHVSYEALGIHLCSPHISNYFSNNYGCCFSV